MKHNVQQPFWWQKERLRLHSRWQEDWNESILFPCARLSHQNKGLQQNGNRARERRREREWEREREIKRDKERQRERERDTHRKRERERETQRERERQKAGLLTFHLTYFI